MITPPANKKIIPVGVPWLAPQGCGAGVYRAAAAAADTYTIDLGAVQHADTEGDRWDMGAIQHNAGG